MAESSKSGKSDPPNRPPPPKVIIPPTRMTPPSVKKHFEHLQPLAFSKVRWFYQEDKKWIPFNGADSLAIEKTFRSLPESLQSPLLIPTDVDRTGFQLPTVRGSLYEVDVLDRECRPIFWKENSIAIMRGTWFKGSLPGSWEPVDEKQAVKIEEAHLQVVRSLGLGSLEANNTASNNVLVIHQIKIGANRIEWHDISEVYIVSESTGSRLAHKIGLGGPTELHRGYQKESEENDCPGEVTHIVFLVHGMGQLYHGDGGIIHSRKKFVDAIEKASKRFFNGIQCADGRVEFFPIEWRSMLKLDEGIIDTITPENLSSLRKVINDTTLDVFYYTSPFYREEIIQAMRKQLNSVYKQYTDRNTMFEKNGGKVSIIAHSLGSVIIHDVLTFWNSYLIQKDKRNADTLIAGGERSYSWFWGWGKPHENPSCETKQCTASDLKDDLHEARLKVAKLEAKLNGIENKRSAVIEEECYSLLFKVETVFNIGSPLGVFLIMRGIRPREDVEQHILPTSVCNRTYNIYDPADPVAYRLEPLIFDYYAGIPPVRLAHVGTLMEAKLPSSPQQGGGWFKAIFGGKSNIQRESVEFQSGDIVDMPKATYEKTEEVLSGKKELDHRIDFVLESSMVEYFSAITSHQAYWHSLDFAKFVLQAIYTYDTDDVQIT